MHVIDAETVIFHFRKADLDQDFGTSEALLTLYSEFGRCARCDSPMDSWAGHEACERRPRLFRSPYPSDVEVTVSFAVYMSSGALRGKEGQLRSAFLRKKRTKAAAGTRTREEVITLLDLQERRCYYCFGSLEGPGGSVNGRGEPTTCHEDHYVSLRWGGSQFISNIVLACVACNTRKRDLHGDDFVQESLEQATRDVRKGLRRIHHARADHASRLLVVVTPDEDETFPIVSGGETDSP